MNTQAARDAFGDLADKWGARGCRPTTPTERRPGWAFIGATRSPTRLASRSGNWSPMASCSSHRHAGDVALQPAPPPPPNLQCLHCRSAALSFVPVTGQTRLVAWTDVEQSFVVLPDVEFPASRRQRGPGRLMLGVSPLVLGLSVLALRVSLSAR